MYIVIKYQSILQHKTLIAIIIINISYHILKNAFFGRYFSSLWNYGLRNKLIMNLVLTKTKEQHSEGKGQPLF